MKQNIFILETNDDITEIEEHEVLQSVGNIISANPNRKHTHVWFGENTTAIDISPNEWADFACFIANESTHNISSFPEDGTFTRCPYSTMDKAVEAFRVYQDIIRKGTYDWNSVEALRDVDCSDAGHYYDCQPEEQENPEPDYDYEPEYTENDYYETESDQENTLTSEEEAQLEESDKFFEKLGLLD